MSSSFDTPRVRRRTVTLTHDKIIKDVPSAAEVRVIRSSAQPIKQSRIDYQDPILGATKTPISESRVANPPNSSANDERRDNQSVRTKIQTGANVLVINASQDTAREITLELSRTLPGCSILFAPTLQLALWILKRRTIDIILSSATLPDGHLSKLHESLEVMSPPPELVILSDLTTTRADLGSHPGYRFVELRRVQSNKPYAAASAEGGSTQIRSLGADLRNDLNNPLQEIVAMAFVATTSAGLSPVAEEALSAIQRAAANMSTVVNSLEDKIRSVVESPSKILSVERRGRA